MKSSVNLLARAAVCCLIAIPICAQEMPLRPDPVAPSGGIGPQLVAWSDLKKPQPVGQATHAYDAQQSLQPKLRDIHIPDVQANDVQANQDGAHPTRPSSPVRIEHPQGAR
jgi:hypothetical protein